MNYRISKSNNEIKGSLTVPASKSISNRLLIIRELSENKFQINNLSDSEDTQVLINAINNKESHVDIGHAGTAMRFLTAYFAITPGCKVLLTGSERMKNRPIGHLVSTLISLGADIEYSQKINYPPLLIKGRRFKGGKAKIDSSVSSQFISALMMIAPAFAEGLELKMENEIISSSYINLTLAMMDYMGVKSIKKDNVITIRPQYYEGKDITVEGDWSGVSYWYQMAALAKEPDLIIKTLQKDSFQGDSQVAEIFKSLGIHTEYLPEGIRITKTETKPKHFFYNFINNPDVVQTLAVTCVMLNIPFTFEGTQSLKIKETDRIVALQNELAKFGATLEYDNKGTLTWDGKRMSIEEKEILIRTYQDHRMALAFAPVALMGYNLIIEEPNVVVKSYPTYWEELRAFGFDIETLEN